MAVKIGASTPWGFWDLDPADRHRALVALADAGVDHLFTADHVSFRGGGGMDGPVQLAALSGIEPRLGVMLGVYLLALRHPVVAARQIADLHRAAPGRITVGIGVGGEDRHEFEVCGVDPSTRGQRTDVALPIVRRLLAGESVDGDGRFFDFTGASILPLPHRTIPFVVGGRSERALRRAGTLGDGWLAAWSSVDRFALGVEIVEEHGAGRTLDWLHGLQVWAGVGDNAREGRDHVAGKMRTFYQMDFAPFERYTPVGTPSQIAEHLAPYVEAGATILNITLCGVDRVHETEAMAEIIDALGSPDDPDGTDRITSAGG